MGQSQNGQHGQNGQNGVDSRLGSVFTNLSCEFANFTVWALSTLGRLVLVFQFVGKERRLVP